MDLIGGDIIEKVMIRMDLIGGDIIEKVMTKKVIID